jgi:hypothetical protein
MRRGRGDTTAPGGCPARESAAAKRAQEASGKNEASGAAAAARGVTMPAGRTTETFSLTCRVLGVVLGETWEQGLDFCGAQWPMRQQARLCEVVMPAAKQPAELVRKRDTTARATQRRRAIIPSRWQNGRVVVNRSVRLRAHRSGRRRGGGFRRRVCARGIR